MICFSSPEKGGTLLVTALPRAAFVTPLGTMNGGGDLSESGSMFGPFGRSSGVPFNVGSGSCNTSGTVGGAPLARRCRGERNRLQENSGGDDRHRAGFKKVLYHQLHHAGHKIMKNCAAFKMNLGHAGRGALWRQLDIISSVSPVRRL